MTLRYKHTLLALGQRNCISTILQVVDTWKCTVKNAENKNTQDVYFFETFQGGGCPQTLLRDSRAQSLFFALGALVQPGVNF